MVVAEMYCREQIVIPEQLPIILKKYAKAVIRTQPYDLLRWSAAYFRCLALEQTPPTKLRYETEQKYGNLTRGYIRILIEQIGKGYYLKRHIMFNKWQELCLPEDQLVEFLSLSRMLTRKNIEWLKLLSVMIGSLNCTFPNTMKMVCELLTDEPEGSPAPIPLWMFRTCYKYLAGLDCSETQEFIDGKKLLPGDILDDDECEDEDVPRIQMAKVFQDLVIDEWKSRMKYDKFNSQQINGNTASDNESVAVTDADSNVSLVSSNFKFIGNFDDPTEILKRAPDFDSVILLLNEEIENIRQVVPCESIESILEQKRKEREEKIKEICDENSETSRQIKEQEYLSLLKEIGPPFSWLHRFAGYSCPKRSYNFIDIPNSPLGSDDEELDYDFDLKKERCISSETSSTAVHFKSSDDRSKTFICEEEIESKTSVSSKGSHTSSIVSQILSEVMCNLSEAISKGLCSVRDVKSLSNVIEQDFKENSEAQRLKGFLDKAESTGMEFNDLNELNNYFMSESVKDSTLKTECCIDEENYENPDETLKACEDPNRIVEIFEESGIEVDNKLLEKKVSETMILGLVEKSNETGKLDLPKTEVDAESVKSFQSDDTTTASVASTRKSAGIGARGQDEKVQTISFLEQQREKYFNAKKGSEETPPEKTISNDPQKSVIPPLPGIGKRVSQEVIQKFMVYMMCRARQQKGLVYPRNWEEDECPPMIDEED